MNIHSKNPAPVAATSPATPGASNERRSREIGYVFAAVGAVLFSTKAVIVKLAYGLHLDAETLLALRMGFSLPFYLGIGILALRDRWQKGLAMVHAVPWIQAILIGLLGYWFSSYCDFLGLQYISAQFERLILFTYPLFVVLLGAAFFGQPAKPRVLAASVISYLGLALIFSENFSLKGLDVAVGAGLVLTASICFALYQLLARDVIRNMGPRLFTCVAMSGAAMGAFVQFFISHPASALVVAGEPLAYAVLIAIGATVIPSFFLNAALHRISAQANSAIGTVSPIVTILLSAAVLGEHLSVFGIAGAVLVIGGIGWFTLSDRAGN